MIRAIILAGVLAAPPSGWASQAVTIDKTLCYTIDWISYNELMLPRPRPVQCGCLARPEYRPGCWSGELLLANPSTIAMLESIATVEPVTLYTSMQVSVPPAPRVRRIWGLRVGLKFVNS